MSLALDKPTPQDSWIYYIAQIGHDIRTPLNVIKGFGDLLEKELVGPLNEQQRNYLNKMLASADDLLAIINQILDWAKWSTGQTVLVKRDVDLVHLALEMHGFFSLRSQNEEVNFVIDTPDSLLFFADDSRLKQVLVNLIDNAFKFTPKGGTITLSMQEQEDDIVITVTDTGCGMSEEVKERIFSPFDTGFARHETEGHGSGLGLWISKAIVEAHNGTLDVESTIGNGSIFTICLQKPGEAL